MSFSLPLRMTILTSAMLAVSLAMASGNNRITVEGVDEFPETESASGNPVYSDSPASEYNFIPTETSNLHARVETDNAGNYLAISVDLPFSVINLDPEEFTASDGLLCNEFNHCVSGYHAFFELPSLDKFPYKTIQLKWNPQGHFPLSFVSNRFDYHFHTETLAELEKLAVGNCGNEHFSSDSELISKAIRQVPARQLPAGYKNAALDSTVAWTGSLLVDRKAIPDSADEFTRIFTHGAWNGNLTSQGNILSVQYLNELKARTIDDPDTEDCFSIPQPQMYPDDNVYPRRWCARYHADGDRVSVSLEDFPKHKGTDLMSSAPSLKSTTLSATAVMIAFLVVMGFVM